jgi:hypothetical protein
VRKLAFFILLIVFLGSGYFLYLKYQKPWKLYPGENCVWGKCETSEIMQKYNYWLDMAVKHNNPDLCQNVEAFLMGDVFANKDYASDQCVAYYYAKTGNFNGCLNLPKESENRTQQRTICLSEFADNPTNLEMCDAIPGKNIKYVCYSNIAKKMNDVSICNKIPENYPHNYVGSRENCIAFFK